MTSLLVGALAVAPLAGAAPASAEPTPTSPQAKAEAIIKPSVVFITTQWKGWIRLSDGDLLSESAYEAYTTCSGFVANSSGYVVTAGHCVDDETMQGGKGVLIQKALSDAVAKGYIEESDVPDLLRIGQANWKIEGSESGSPPERTVQVYQAEGASGITVARPLQANVIEFKSLTKGDVALLKVEPSSPMPALEVAKQAPDGGAEVLSAGFPGSVDDVTDPSLSASFKDGRTSSQRTVGGVPFVEISAAMSPGMSGGPTVDMQGRVLGTNSFGPADETQSFNFITATSSVNALLSGNGVKNQLNAADKAYRAGLAEYYAGHYRAAVEQFDKVLALQPNHQQAQLFKQKAVARFGEEPTGFGPMLIVIGVAAAVLILFAIGLVLLLSRRRRGTAPVSPVPASPAGPAAPQWAHASAQPGPPVVIPGQAQPAAQPWPSDGQPVWSAISPRPDLPAAPVPNPVVVTPDPVVVTPDPVSTNLPPRADQCSRCGSQVTPGAKFCASCGHPL